MFLSFFLIIILLILALFQIYFIGKYFSITQEAFVNKIYVNISLGFLFYIFFTFIFIVPFYFFSAASGYIVVILAIKDIFIVLFLVSRREIFKRNKINFIGAFALFIIVILVSIFYYFVAKKVLKLETNILKHDGYFLLSKIIQYIMVLTFFNLDSVLYLYIWPLLIIMMVSMIASFYSMFIKINNYHNFFLTLFTTIMLILLFNPKLSIEIFSSYVILIFLFQIGMNVITFSRRRYSTLFGVGVIASWAVNNNLFLALITLAICLVFAYGILKRPRLPLFTIQLISPIIIIWTFWIRSYSNALAVAVIIFVISLYISLFYFARYSVIVNKPIINKLSFIIPLLLFLSLFMYSLIKIFTQNIATASFLWKGRTFINNFNNEDVGLVINIIYYFFLLGTTGYSLYTMVSRKRIIGINLVFLISSLCFFISYNPLTQETLYALGFSKISISKMPMLTIVPVIMTLFILIVQKIIKFLNNNHNYKTIIINSIRSIKSSKK